MFGASRPKQRDWRIFHAVFRKSGTLLWTAAIVSLAAAFTADDLLRLVMIAIAGTLLAIVTALTALAVVTEHQRSEEELVLQRFLENEASPSILLDPDHSVSWANQAARRTFPNLTSKGIVRELEPSIPNIQTILRQLHARLGHRERVSDDIVTPKKHLRAALHRMGLGRVLLRLEHITEHASETNHAPPKTAVPLMTVSARGTVLSINEALRKVLGKRVRRLNEVFHGDLPTSGQRVKINGADNEVLIVRAYLSELAGDRLEIALLPEAPEGDASKVASGVPDLPVALLKLGQGGVLLETNAAARRLLKLAPDEAKPVFGDLVSGLGRPVSDWINEALLSETQTKPEVMRLRRSKEDTFIQVSLGNQGQGKHSELTAIIQDATELKTMEAQFVQGQKMQAIGQLAGGIAHDFNNLLTAISGHCDLLLLRHDHGDGDYADLEQINQNANRASALVGQLLAFSRKQTLLPEVIDLRDTLADLTHLLNRLVGETVTLSLFHDPDLPTVRADKRQLEQVVMNLVVNARDAMPNGGDISIETKRVVLSKPMIKGRAQVPVGEYACVCISDQGVGIAPELANKVFEPFMTTKRLGEGTGLGLSTAYGIVKQSGGFIFFESIEGKGTEFTLYFPSHHKLLQADVEDQVEISSPKATIKPVSANDAVILLVEDEAPVRAFAARALRLRGYTVLEASCAEEALETLESDALQIDLFVSDVIMPGMDGPSWVKTARERRPDTKAVFVSGYAEDLLSGSESSLENAVFLPKPFSLQQLTETVQSQLVS